MFGLKITILNEKHDEKLNKNKKINKLYLFK